MSLAPFTRHVFSHRIVLILLLASGTILKPDPAPCQEPPSFEIQEGYLSENVRALVRSHGWTLIWQSVEDRSIDQGFSIPNESLQASLQSLLSMYQGKFVADLYAGNKVVLVAAAPPRTNVELPGLKGPGPSTPAAAPAAAPASEKSEPKCRRTFWRWCVQKEAPDPDSDRKK